MCSLRLARVVDSHPDDHAVDLIMLDDHSRFVGVQVMVPVGAVNAGSTMPIKPGMPASGDKWDLRAESPRDVKAVVSMVGRLPIVLGFLLPQINEMTFADGRAITRYPSDVYVMCDAAGNFEIAHPSGTFLRIGTPGHDDLTGRDFDGKWSIQHNTTSTPTVQITVGAAGAVKAAITIDPSGNLTGHFQGAADITTVGTCTVHAPHIVLDSAVVDCTGKLNVAGDVTVTGGDVIADGIRLKGHHHTEHDGPSTSPAVA